MCNDCQDLVQKAVSFNDLAVASVKRNYHRIHFCNINKDEAINKMNNTNLKEKSRLL